MTSALKAIAYGVEVLRDRDDNPVLAGVAVEAMRAFKTGLPVVMADPRNISARAQVVYGAWLCSTGLGYAALALHHMRCHTPCGSFGMPHAETHAILIPHTAGFNASAVPDLFAPVAEVFGDMAGGGLWDFVKACGAPLAVRDLGMTPADLDRAADLATANPSDSPRAFTRADIRDLPQAAWQGMWPD